VRIISGKYRRKLINPPKNINVRPTTDFSKESLFNILNNNFDFKKIKVLDLFAGTGSISYEFASRGCPEIDLVEVNFRHIIFIKKTSAELNFNQINAIRNNTFQFIKFCKSTYDIIFADPPFDLKEIKSIPDLIFEKNLLKKNGWFIIEHSNKIDFQKLQYFFEKRQYGSVNFSFFK